MQKAPREQSNFRYQEKLKDKFAQHPEVRRIAKHRYVPKHIKSGQKELETIKASQTRKYVVPSAARQIMCKSTHSFPFFFFFFLVGMLIVCCTASPERSTSECWKLRSKLFVKNHSVATVTRTLTYTAGSPPFSVLLVVPPVIACYFISAFLYFCLIYSV